MKRIELRDVKFRSSEYREGFLAGFKFFSQKECIRHCEDVRQINLDICDLIDIDIPEGLDMSAWYDVNKIETCADDEIIYPPIVKRKK
jgi:hypothetical protein